MSKTAVITGVAGQDGSYLAELLLSKGYEVYGLLRSSGRDVYHNLANVLDEPNFHLTHGDILHRETLQDIAASHVDEIYHLAALSHVGQSFDNPLLSFESNALATIRLLEYIRSESPLTKLYLASTSEMLSRDTLDSFLGDEDSALNAHSPYAVGKVTGHLMGKVYREAFDMFIVSGIAYNHESRRRGPKFVTKKIADGLRSGKQVCLGKVDTYRDWHHAQDTVYGMWLAMQHNVPDSYVFASGKARSVKEFALEACKVFGVEYEDAIYSDPSIFEVRPWDVDYLCGNPLKAQSILGWDRKWSFEEMVGDVCLRWPVE